MAPEESECRSSLAASLAPALDRREDLHCSVSFRLGKTEIAATLMMLGQCVAHQGQLLSGLDHCRQALSMFRTIHAANPNHPDIIVAQNVVEELEF